MNNDDERSSHESLPSRGKQCSKRLYKDEQKAQRRTTMLLIFLSLVVLAFILIFSNSYYNRSAAKYTKKQVTETMTKVSVSISSAFSDRVAAWHDELDVTAQFAALHGLEPNEESSVEKICEHLANIHSHSFDKLGMLTENGSLVLSSGECYMVQEDPSFSFFLQNTPSHSCMVTEIEDLKDCLLFAIPYKNKQNDEKHPIVGIFGIIRKDTIADTLSTDAFGANYAYIVIADDKGNVIVDTESKRRFGNNLIDTFGFFATPETIEKLKADLATGTSDTIELMGVTERFLMYYSPVEHFESDSDSDFEGSINNLRLMILTSTAALDKNIAGFSAESKILLYCLLIFIAIMTVGINVWMARKNHHLLIKESIDPLTGLLNINRFKSDANLLLHLGDKRYVIASVRPIYFKLLNSRLGHHRADDILREMGKNIQAFLHHDEIATRVYSDHFAVLLKADNETDESRIQLLKQSLEKALYPHDSQIELSVGAYHIKHTDKDISALLDYARYAQSTLQKDTHQTAGIVYYDNAAYEQHAKELQIIEAAPAALANHEFVVYYQLKRGIGLQDRWVGCEALVRWNHEKFGFLSPGVFIDLFEKNGFIIQLDHYVFETACRDLRQCMDEGRKTVPVSINLSKRHFENHNFLDEYEAILKKYRIPRELIEFEITETLAINNTEKVRNAIDKIHKMGCRCALDDFGTGYSAFDMVMSFPLDTIKLDASLFRGNSHSNQSRKLIIETLIELSHKLDMSVVAEGIETAEQVAFLAEKKCDIIQGYFFAKPLPCSACRELLEEGNP